MSSDSHYNESPAKKRKLSLDRHEQSSPFALPPRHEHDNFGAILSSSHGLEEGKPKNNAGASISISANPRLAGQTVAPFLAKHIPKQYAPLGGLSTSPKPSSANPNTKYCYRHRPDLKCRRQADEPSMDQLQHVSCGHGQDYVSQANRLKELEDLSHSDQQAITHVWSLFSAAPGKHRNLMLQGILTQCCFPQLSYLAGNIRELVRIDFLSALPPEISFKVLCYLDTTSLCKAAQVSQRWRTLADDDVVWHKMCEQHINQKCTKCGWGLPLLERKRLRASKRQLQLRATGRGLNEWSPDITPGPEGSSRNEEKAASMGKEKSNSSTEGSEQHGSQPVSCNALEEESYFKPRYRPWKDVYKDRFKVGINWKHGRYSIKVFRGHTNGVMCLQFHDNILATGSYDATIKIWDMETCEEIRTLRGHESGIRCLQFDDTKLISGSIDRSLKIWNWRTGQCLSTYTGHSGGVIGLHFDSALLASASMDKTIKIWNFEDKSTFILRGHTDWVNAVKLDSPSRTVVSASDDFTVKMWDLDTKQCIRTFEGHVGQVQQVLLMPTEFEFKEIDDHDGASSTASASSQAVASQDTYDPPRHECFGSGFVSNDRQLPPRYMLTSALDSTIRLWDTASGRCLHTYFGHLEGVWALAADTLRIVSGAEDRMVKVWDPNRGYERTFTGHAGPVTCIGLSDSKLCTGSEDCEVRMYSF
ncbi:MAG: hypothetical protein LQ338_003445 [Usnochroma carphineum]|nr:MAG: hypothetical protein LQ338_003445 [Usnochroma carphineum]